MNRARHTPGAEMNVPNAGYKPNKGKDDHLSVVYIVGPDMDGPVKIGKTFDICARIESLRHGCWLPLHVFDIRMALPVFMSGFRFSIRDQAERGAYALEHATHTKLKELGAHLRGEWYDLSVREALIALGKCATDGNVRCFSIEDLASVSPSYRDDKAVAISHKKLLTEMVRIKTMAAAKSDVTLDLSAG